MLQPDPDEALRARLAEHATSPFYRAEVETMLAAAACTPGISLLEVGSGNGFLVGKVASLGASPIGIDVSTDTVRASRRLTGLPAFLRATAVHLPFRTGTFDVVIAQHVIEHIKEDTRALHEWHRTLRPGGLLVVLTPNARYPDPGLFEDPDHVRIYDRRTLTRRLREVGFRVLRAWTILPYLRGHIVFGLRHQRLFERIPPWSGAGRSLVAVARK